jgi:hypothetical protein
MLADDIEDRIILAGHPAEIDDIIRGMWGHHFAGNLTDNEIETLDEAARARRETFAETRPKLPAVRNNSPRATPRRPRSHNRQASIERRRRMANRALPDILAAKFTCGEKAVLAVVGQAVRERGTCNLSNGEIAGRAGVCVRHAQQTIRRAEGLGLLTVKERRLSAFRNDTNIIHIISPEWRSWLRLSSDRLGGGCKNPRTTQTRINSPHLNRTPSAFNYPSKRLGEQGRDTS